MLKLYVKSFFSRESARQYKKIMDEKEREYEFRILENEKSVLLKAYKFAKTKKHCNFFIDKHMVFSLFMNVHNFSKESYAYIHNIAHNEGFAVTTKMWLEDEVDSPTYRFLYLTAVPSKEPLKEFQYSKKLPIYGYHHITGSNFKDDPYFNLSFYMCIPL